MRNKTSHNSRFAKAGFSCFYESEVLNSSFVPLMKFSAENPHLRKAANRYQQGKKNKPLKYGRIFTSYRHLQN
ncbi:hypothetical protein B0A58_10100 [Flavobacterium branchiophilum NBRC 15030 = ATCC 35035]|uniref:hypothetical protein n=1 Tax=Flavobacterium branchiophilum TaxID=55197 RepID=UPI000B5B9F6D|nr:hypothetical protein [Flavobacterium branchiophilum]OXA74731.1 hypothetical protein B0A58_10100 [Flavobacterium branchiophilum NBRC 15030 = ATCC 35035]